MGKFMRALIAMPHFYRAEAQNPRHGSLDSSTREARLRSLEKSVLNLHALFGGKGFATQSHLRRYLPTSNPLQIDFDLVIFTAEGAHLLAEASIASSMYTHIESSSDPRFIGWECHRYLRSQLGNYDLYGFIEDDIVIHDPLFFTKLTWLQERAQELGRSDIVFQPQRFEMMDAAGPLIKDAVTKIYVDYQIYNVSPYSGPTITASCLGYDATFAPALNPHAGCFFINGEQLFAMSEHPQYLDNTDIWKTPLDTAATGFLMRALSIYKPRLDSLAFFEIEHHHAHTVRHLTGAPNERFIEPQGFVYLNESSTATTR